MDALTKIRQIAGDVASKYAGDVDTRARFPREAFDALKAEGLMAEAVPRELGGAGAGMYELGQQCSALAQACSSSGMILAMHHIQVACIARHAAGSPALLAWLRELVQRQYLIASATSEVGTYGDTRSSICAVAREGGRFTLEKDATTVSYGADADALLVTARRVADAPPSDQVLVLLRPGDYELTLKGKWDTMGMRGTSSPPFLVRGTGPEEFVLPGSFAESAAQTMVPYSHILWSALWQGIAAEAVSRASAFVRADARRQPGKTPETATRLARVVVQLQEMRNNWTCVAKEFDELSTRPDGMQELLGLGWGLRFNNLKIGSSEAAPKIVHQALQVVGLAGYKNDSKFSMDRLYRDSLSGALMITNERIAAKSASMLLVFKDDHE